MSMTAPVSDVTYLQAKQTQHKGGERGKKGEKIGMDREARSRARAQTNRRGAAKDLGFCRKHPYPEKFHAVRRTSWSSHVLAHDGTPFNAL
jgi:hypothetical protein